MKFGPLLYRDPKGIYEEDPTTEEMRDKMERALVTKAQREIRRIMTSRAWVIQKHGSHPHAMGLDVSFHVLTDADITALQQAAAVEERKRLGAEIARVLL